MDLNFRSIAKKKESACKPGSVENSHSSGIAVAGDFKRPTRKHAGTRAATCVATFLFGLAPSGVCHATECCHRRGALLPHRFTLTSFIAEASAVCFLLHFPSAHAAQALPGTSSARSPDFPPHFARNAATVRPTPGRTISTCHGALKLLVHDYIHSRAPFASSSARA